MSYILPTILAVILHLLLASSFIISQMMDLKQSREMPRHIQAQLYDIKALSTAIQKKKTIAKDADLVKQKEPKKTPPKKSDPVPEKPQPVQKKQDESKQQAEKARQLQKKDKAEQRKIAQQKLKKDLQKKKDQAAKQRKIESERKLAAQKKTAEEQALKKQQRQKIAADKKLAKQQAAKKAAAAKKRKAQALAKQKNKAKKQALAEKARVKALRKQAAEEERYAADLVAKEMASGVDVYIKRILDGNLSYNFTVRKGTKALLRIRLLTSGRVVGVELLESSGNPSFDRAAEQAVWKSEKFPKVADIAKASPEYFNRELRTFTILFEPAGTRW